MKTTFLSAGAALLGVWLGFLAGSTPKSIGGNPNINQGEAASISKATKSKGSVVRERLLWEQVESDEPQKYIANLRGIGCPEWTIAAIVRAMVLATYQAKVNLIFNPLAKYWSTQSDMAAVDAQVKAINGERDQLLETLNLPGRPFRDDGLPPEKAGYVMAALQLYPQATMTPTSDSGEWEKFLENRRARVDYLSQFLTPDELLTYRITQDGATTSIGMLLRDINPSDDEFRKVFSALDGENLNQTQRFLAQDVESKLKQALGDDRYAEYRDQMAPDNVFFNLFVHSLNLTDTQLQQLKELRSNSDGMDMAEYKGAVANIIPPSQLAIYFSDRFIYKATPH